MNRKLMNDEVRLKLLQCLPKFQKHLTQIRKTFKIPAQGFVGDEEAGVWLEQEIAPTATAGQLHPFYEVLEALGRRYHLPYYITAPGTGLERLVLLNDILIPAPWVLSRDQEGHASGAERWVNIKVTRPLTGEEAAQLTRVLRKVTEVALPKQVGIPVNMRDQSDLERNIEIWHELAVKRQKQPVRRKSYIQGSYLDVLKKKRPTPDEAKSMERQNKSSVELVFDEATSVELADRYAMTSDAVRKAKEEMTRTMIKLFGEENLGE